MLKTGHQLSDAEIAERYQQLGASLEMPAYYYRAVAGFAGPLGRAAVLDAGCGTGDLLSEIQRLNPGAALRGIELAQSRVDAARRRLGEGADIRCGSIMGRLPFEPRCADVVLLTEVIEHLKDPVAGLINILALLKPGGAMIVTFPNASAWLPFSPVAEKLTPRFRPMRGFLPHEHPLRTIQPIDTAFSQSEVFAILRQSGLRVTRAACCEVLPYLAEFAYKFAPRWNIAPLRRPFDWLATRLGATVLGYRVFTHCVFAS